MLEMFRKKKENYKRNETKNKIYLERHETKESRIEFY